MTGTDRSRSQNFIWAWKFKHYIISKRDEQYCFQNNDLRYVSEAHKKQVKDFFMVSFKHKSFSQQTERLISSWSSMPDSVTLSINEVFKTLF